MPKFNVGDSVYCTLHEDEWDDSMTVRHCGDGDKEMKGAIGGRPLTVKFVGRNSECQNYQLASDFWGSEWWFHESDLEFFNLNLENK